MAPKFLKILALSVLLSSCAYGYAGKEGKRRSQREYKSSSKVVTIKEEADVPNDKPDDKPAEKKEPESPCGTPTFEIFFYGDQNHVTKTVDCTARSVVDVQQEAMQPAVYADAQSAGLPEGSWYLLVDPKGATPDVLNNAQLLKLSREFQIEYYGKESRRELLVYLYQQEDVQ